MLNDLFAVMAPTLVGTLIGWIWAKKSIPFPAEFVSNCYVHRHALPIYIGNEPGTCERR